MSRVDNVEAKDARLVEKVRKICRQKGVSAGLHQCKDFEMVILHTLPAYYYLVYTKRGRDGDVHGYSEFIQLAAPLFPALPVYLVRWRLHAEAAKLPPGFIVLAAEKGQSTMIACRPSMRFLTPPGVRVREQQTCEACENAGLVWLSVFTSSPIRICDGLNEATGRLSGFIHIGHEDVGIISLVPFIIRGEKFVVIDTWKRRAYSLSEDIVEYHYSLGVDEAPRPQRGVGTGIAWFVSKPRQKNYVLMPVSYAEYSNECNVSAFLSMLAFALIVRRDSLSLLAGIARKYGGEMNKFLDMFTRLMRREVYAGSGDEEFLKKVVKEVGLDASIAVNIDSVASLARSYLRCINLECDINIDDMLVRTAVQEAAKVLGCKAQQGEMYYICPNLYVLILLEASRLFKDLPVHRLELLVEHSVELAKHLYGDVFLMLAAQHA